MDWPLNTFPHANSEVCKESDFCFLGLLQRCRHHNKQSRLHHISREELLCTITKSSKF